MRVLYIVLLVLLYHNVSQAQNFTAQSFCQNPRAFICGQASIQSDPALRGRITEVVDRLKDRFPSFALYMNQRPFEPTLGGLTRLNGEFRQYLGRQIIEQYLSLNPELAEAPQSEMTWSSDYVSVLDTVGTDYVMIPEKEIAAYISSLQRWVERKNGYSSEDTRMLFRIQMNASPVLSAAKADFGIEHLVQLEDVNEKLTAAMREEFSSEIAAGLSRNRSQISDYRENMRNTLLEIGYQGDLSTTAARLDSASFNIPPRNEISCNTLRRLYVPNASINTGTGAINRCEDNYILFGNQAHINVFSNNHELAHLFDFERSTDQYHPSYITCVQEHLGPSLDRGRDDTTLADDVRSSMAELTADYVGVAATVRYLRENNFSQTEALSLLSREFQGTYCDTLGDSSSAHFGHASDEIRLNRILGGSPQLQEYFGCSRFAGSVPVNPCHPFQDNGGGVDPPASSGPVED